MFSHDGIDKKMNKLKRNLNKVLCFSLAAALFTFPIPLKDAGIKVQAAGMAANVTPDLAFIENIDGNYYVYFNTINEKMPLDAFISAIASLPGSPIVNKVYTSAAKSTEVTSPTQNVCGNYVAEITKNGVKRDYTIVSDMVFPPMLDVMPASDVTVVSFRGQSVWHNNKKSNLSEPIQRIGNDCYISEADALAVFGQAVTGYVSVKSLVPERSIVTWSAKDLMFLSASPLDCNEAKQEGIFDMLQYERPSLTDILEKFNAKQAASSTHPRVMVTQDDIDRMKRLTSIQTAQGGMRNVKSNMISRANDQLTPELPVYSLADILNLSRTARDRMFYLGMGYLMTKDGTAAEKAQAESYKNRAYEILQAAGEFPQWGQDKSYLALSEMTAAFGIAYDWMYDGWTVSQREYIRNTAVSKGLLITYKIYANILKTEDFGISSSAGWTMSDGNWNAVCAGSSLMASAAFFDTNPEFFASLIQISLRGLEYMFRGFSPDGAYSEGIGYWSYNLRYLCSSFAAMQTAFGTHFKMLTAPGLEETIGFAFANRGAEYQNNYHDVTEGESTASGNTSYLAWFAQVFKNKDWFEIRKNTLSSAFGRNIYDAVFYNPEAEYTKEGGFPDKDAHYRDLELMSLRSDDEESFLSFHGGKVINSSHDHVDAGAFVLDLLGERWAVDLGAESYSVSGYFTGWNSENGQRFKYYRTRAEGHNTLLLNQSENPAHPGQSFSGFTEVTEKGSDANMSYGILNMTEAYAANVSSAKRGYMLFDNRSKAIIRDELIFNKDNTDIYWFMHTKAAITISDDNKTATLAQNGKSITVRMTCTTPSAGFTVMDAVPLAGGPNPQGQSTNSGYKKLVIHTTAPAKNVPWAIQVAFTADGTQHAAVHPLDTWASMISTRVWLGGDDFEEAAHNYTVTAGTTAEITDAQGENSGKVLRVSSSGKSQITFPADTSAYSFGNVIYQFSVLPSSDKSTSVSFGDNELIRLENGIIYFRGLNIGTYPASSWVPIAVTFKPRKLASIYINGAYAKIGSQDVKDAYIRGNIGDLSFSSDGGAFLLDDVLIRKDNNSFFYMVDYDFEMPLANGSPLPGSDSNTISFAADSYKTTYTGNAGYGREGNAYFISSMNFTPAASTSLQAVHNAIPFVTAGSVTFEIKVMGDGSTSGAGVWVALPVNNPQSPTNLITLAPGGNHVLQLNGATICNWERGVWYVVAVTFTIGSDTPQFYLNGTPIPTSTTGSLSIGSVSSVGGKMILTSRLTSTSKLNYFSAFDDIRLYKGNYQYIENEDAAVLDLCGKDGFAVTLNNAPAYKLKNGSIKVFSDKAVASRVYVASYENQILKDIRFVDLPAAEKKSEVIDYNIGDVAGKEVKIFFWQYGTEIMPLASERVLTP